MSNTEQNSNQNTPEEEFVVIKNGDSKAATQPAQQPRPRKPRQPRMRLPFDNRKKDAGEWAYDHRLGLSVMVIAYLVLGIVFFSSKIIVGRKPHTQGIYIELENLEELMK